MSPSFRLPVLLLLALLTLLAAGTAALAQEADATSRRIQSEAELLAGAARRFRVRGSLDDR